jgi:hypothetical protein
MGGTMMARAGLVLVIILVMLGLCGCAPDPRNTADANAITLKAQQDAFDQQQAREKKIAEDALSLDQKKAQSQQWTESWNFYVRWTMVFLTIASAMLILSTSTGASWALIGIGRAASFAAALRARQISLDDKTGSFPALSYEGKGIVTLTDLNTGLTVRLDTRNEADRQMIAGAMALRLGGVVSRNARMAKENASGVAMVGTHPAVIGARVDGLKVGEYVMEDENAN